LESSERRHRLLDPQLPLRQQDKAPAYTSSLKLSLSISMRLSQLAARQQTDRTNRFGLFSEIPNVQARFETPTHPRLCSFHFVLFLSFRTPAGSWFPPPRVFILPSGVRFPGGGVYLGWWAGSAVRGTPVSPPLSRGRIPVGPAVPSSVAPGGRPRA
jgi:hypothetical protein